MVREGLALELKWYLYMNNFVVVDTFLINMDYFYIINGQNNDYHNKLKHI